MTVVELPEHACSLCGDESIVRVELTDGCGAWPDAREQELCWQHSRSIEPVGDIDVVIVRRPDIFNWRRT